MLEAIFIAVLFVFIWAAIIFAFIGCAAYIVVFGLMGIVVFVIWYGVDFVYNVFIRR